MPPASGSEIVNTAGFDPVIDVPPSGFDNVMFTVSQSSLTASVQSVMSKVFAAESLFAQLLVPDAVM